MRSRGPGSKGGDASTPPPSTLVDSIDEDTLSHGNEAERPAAPIELDLPDHPVPAVLFRLYAEAFTGALLLKKDDTKKVITFQSGYPISARSNVVDECLGKLLHLDGRIDDDQLRESLVTVGRTGKRQGEVLVEIGAISREELFSGLQLQARFRIGETFSWERGLAKTFPGARPAGDAVPIGLSPSTLIFESVRAFMPPARVMERLRQVRARYLWPSPDPTRRFQDLRVPDEALPLLARVDGRATTGELLRGAELPVPVASALIYTLLCTEMVVPEDRPWSGQDRGSLKPLHRASSEPSHTQHTAPRVYLARLLERLRGESPWEILGVPRDAPYPTLALAYRKRAAERHPDRLGVDRSERGLRKLAEEALALTTAAFEKLTTPDEAENETAPLTSDAHAETAEIEDVSEIDDQVQRIIEAEGHHRRGLALMDAGHFDAAARVLARAVSACEEEGEFRASLAWALFQSGLDELSATHALEHLDQAVVSSRSAKPLLYRAHVLRFLERHDEAILAFQAALRRDPENEEARSELERIQEELDDRHD